MTVSIKVHRGTESIGGTCIEVMADSGRIILDLGLPLMENGGGEINVERQNNPTVENGMIPDVTGLTDGNCDKPILGVLLSHAHPDHYGLLEHVHADIPIHMSEESKALIGVGNVFYPEKLTLPETLARCTPFNQEKAFTLGAFTITPFLMDHSAFGASSLLIEVEGKRILYTGDMRAHGRKGKVFWALPHKVGHVDCMLMEGTTLGGKHHDGYNDEAAVEEGMVKTFQHDHATFVLGAGSNVDWLVSLYRASKRTGKQLVLDLYQFYLLTRLKQFSPALPPHDSDHVRVLYTKYQAEKLEQHGLVDVMTKEALCRKISRDEICAHPDKMVMRISRGEMKRLADKMECQGNMRFIYSMWQGYLERDSDMANFPRQYGCEWQSIHTSGHAWLEDLQKLTSQINPDMLIPIHTLQGDKFEKYFENVVRIKDGKEIRVGDVIRERLRKMSEWAIIRSKEAPGFIEKDQYIRIGGAGFRAVSLARESPLSGFGKNTDTKIAIVEKHFNENEPGKVSGKKEERRLQAYMIREALQKDGNLEHLIGLQFGSETFDEIKFALDEISLGDRNNPVRFHRRFNGQEEGVIRCDLLTVAIKDEKSFPMLIELKYDRSLGRLIEQLDEFSKFITDDYKVEFAALLKACTGIDNVDCSKCYQMMIWPKSPSGKERKETKETLKSSNISVIEYTPSYEEGDKNLLNSVEFEYVPYE